jgi:hypothetical protein
MSQRKLLNHLSDFFKDLLAQFFCLFISAFLDLAIPVDIKNVIHHVEPNYNKQAIIHERVLFVLGVADFGGNGFQEIDMLTENKKKLRESLVRNGDELLEYFMND